MLAFTILTGVFPFLQTVRASASPATLLATGFESGETQPTWSNDVDFSSNVSGYAPGITPEMSVVTGEQSYTGSAALRYSGKADGGTATNAYFKVFDVSIPVTENTSLSYYIYPQQDNGRYVAVDFYFSDGSTLRDSSSKDQNGYSLHPAAGHGGKIPLNKWSQVQSDFGREHAGKTIEKIWVAYDRGGSSGQFRGYIDNISIIANQRNSQVISTIYPTEDVVVADFNAVDYGADTMGVKDSTVAIQQAIDACYSFGGGTVWLPAGHYKVSGTISVRPFVTLRGDWRDPDTPGSGYGTVIKANVSSSTELTPGLFRIGGSAGVIGLTVFYPEQTAVNPKPYPYTFEIPGRAWQGEANYMASTVKNVTLLNAYQGVAASITPNDRGLTPAGFAQVHETASIINVKGTALKNGLQLYNGAEIGYTKWVRLSNSYWANAGSAYNAPSEAALNAWTRANGTAFIFGDLEFDEMYQLVASHYKTGIQLVTGQRVTPSLEIAWAHITETDIAVDVIQNNPDGLGLALSRSVLKGSQHAIRNQTVYPVKVIDSTIDGPVTGSNISVTHPGSPAAAPFTPTRITKPAKAALFDVTKAPFNAAYTRSGTTLPATDATAAIQSALDAAGSNGGGIVYLPAGWYRVNGHLSVPAGVELRGSSPVLHRDQQDSSLGTVLMAYEGKDTTAPDTATALITMNGDGAGLRGLRVFYPENNPNSAISRYPFTIRGNGGNIYIVNVMSPNSYNGIDLLTHRNDNHYVYGYAAGQFNKGIVVGASSYGQIEDSFANGNMATRLGYRIANWVTEGSVFAKIIDPQTRPNLQWIVIDGASNEQLLNVFSFGANTTYNVISGYADIYNGGADGMSASGYAVRAGSGANVKIINLFVSGGTTSLGTPDLYNAFKVH